MALQEASALPRTVADELIAVDISMMDRLKAPQMPKEARIRYLDADYQIEAPGTFVRCAVTGTPIPLDDLKYWSVEQQEAYVDAHASLKRYQEKL